MSEKPIIFSGPMVRAILAGQKTQTRRVYKGLLPELGTLLWVRENFQGNVAYENRGYPPSNWGNKPIWYTADGKPLPTFNVSDRIRPSIHMPRWMSRITLEVVALRVESLQDMKVGDDLAEGFDSVPAFRKTWDKLNAHRGFGWDVNPTVAVYTFRRVYPRIKS